MKLESDSTIWSQTEHIILPKDALGFWLGRFANSVPTPTPVPAKSAMPLNPEHQKPYEPFPWARCTYCLPVYHKLHFKSNPLKLQSKIQILTGRVNLARAWSLIQCREQHTHSLGEGLIEKSTHLNSAQKNFPLYVMLPASRMQSLFNQTKHSPNPWAVSNNVYFYSVLQSLSSKPSLPAEHQNDLYFTEIKAHWAAVPARGGWRDGTGCSAHGFVPASVRGKVGQACRSQNSEIMQTAFPQARGL